MAVAAATAKVAARGDSIALTLRAISNALLSLAQSLLAAASGEWRAKGFRSLDATPFPFAPELKPLACVGSTAVLGRMTAFTVIENGRQL